MATPAKRKPRITIERAIANGYEFFHFVVKFPGKGWKKRTCLTWNEALYAAGLMPLKETLYEA